MTEIDDNKKKELIKLFNFLPLIVKWIEKDAELSDDDFKRLRTVFPEAYEITKNYTFEELIEINSEYSDSLIYGENINLVLSKKGRRWLRGMVSKLHEFSLKYD